MTLPTFKRICKTQGCGRVIITDKRKDRCKVCSYAYRDGMHSKLARESKERRGIENEQGK